MDLNKTMLIGRLTRDPEARTTAQGITVTNFGLATNRVWKDQQGNQQDATEFHNIVAWRRLGEICAQYLKKGRQVYVEGHLQTRSWEDQDGKKNYRTEVVADSMIMLGSRSEAGEAVSKERPATSEHKSNNDPKAEPVMTVSTSSPQESKVAPTSDEEIRIEDIPF
jgi:single-strand DNA-binding protein